MGEWIKRSQILHLWLGMSAVVVLLFHLSKGSRRLMNAWVTYITAPLKRALSGFSSLFPFSVAELLIALAVIGALVLLIHTLRQTVSWRLRLYRVICGTMAALLTVYGSFGLFFGTNYYTDSFQDRAGIHAQATTVDELYRVTALFAQGLADTGSLVERDDQGQFAVSQHTYFAESVEVYRNLEQRYPFLAHVDTPPKPLISSLVMQYTDYTGFYFPYTGEANINVLAPDCQIPATIVHEFAHQRGIASENEANLVAILACITSDNPTFAYSGYLMGYSYLSSSLYRENPGLYRDCASLLTDEVRADLACVQAYHAKKNTLAIQVTNVVYDNVLKSYGNESGIKSYGEVVDLLLAYF